jgi:Bcr/CflA subfamily drug resistance transporter
MHTKSDSAILFILMPLVLSIAISMDIYVPSLINIMQAFSINQTAVQWTLTIYMLGVGTAQLFCGPLTDYYGRRRIVLVGLIIYLTGSLICIFSPSITILIIGRLLQSVGSCSAVVIAFAIVRDLYSVRKSARMYSYLNSVTMIAPVLAPMLGGYLNIWTGSWRASFVFLFLFGLASFCSIYYFLQETLPDNNRIKINIMNIFHRYSLIFKNIEFVTNSFYALTALVILFSFCGISSLLLINVLHVSKQWYGICFGSNALSFIIAGFFCIKIVEKMGMKISILIGSILLLIGGLAMLLINYYAGLTVAHFILPMFIVTAGVALMMGPAIAGALANFSSMAGTASALLSSMQFLSAALFGSIILRIPAISAIPFALLILIFGMISFVLILSRIFADTTVTNDLPANLG